MRLRRRLTPPLLTLLLSLVLSPAAPASEAEAVKVVNFPKVQSINGTVDVEEPIPGTRLVHVSEEVVAPADPKDAINLIAAGTLEARGFRSAVVSLAGQIKSNYPGSGAVGALLVPDTGFFIRAFEEDGEALLSVRIEAPVDSESGSYFAVTQPQLQLAFPSYRVYFFNTTERPAGVNLYVYLGN